MRPLLTDRSSLRWAAPAAAVALLAAGVGLSRVTASADGGLPTLTAQQLLVDAQASAVSGQVRGLSGVVSSTADLGLPQLPGLSSAGGASGDASLTSIVSGTHTWRVWVGGATTQRVALMGGMGETDVVRNGRDVWLWSSKDQSAMHTTLPAEQAGQAPRALPTDAPRTPAEAASRALATISPTTQVTTTGLATVAGRSAYELVLTPRDTTTRVGQVRVALDSETKVLLRTQVFATGASTPAIDVAYTSVDFAVPPASTFTFTPPPGTTVTQRPFPTAPSAASKAVATAAERKASPRVVGTGWSSVLVARLPQTTGVTPSGTPSDGAAQSLLSALPRVSGAWGTGRLLDGRLFSAVLTDDGRVAVGAVPPAQLYAALAAS
ncbi:sigma-E factor regulatory protein RseB domain-containing protein [Dermatophilaceae bacterium Soc4.6]